MNPVFWKGKSVFLTGHTGFKGGWLSLWLQHLGARVTGFALRPPTQPSLFETARVQDGMASVIGDIRDLDVLTKAMQASQPHIVLHLAAQPLVRRSYVDPVETYSTNVMGTVNLFESVRKTPSVRAVVNVTTDKCYLNHEWVWAYRENDQLGGHDPYSNSKACSELVTSAYRSSFFNAEQFGAHQVAIASARAGNVIGGGDWAADRLIPDTLAAFAEARPVVIRSPKAIRPWQHVLEPLRGYLTLAERLYVEGPAFGQGFNFGPTAEDARPVEWIVNHLSQLWGSGANWRLDTQLQPHEAGTLKLDTSKASHLLDWRPKLSLEQALELTVSWTRARLHGGDMQATTQKQIVQYQTLCVQ